MNKQPLLVGVTGGIGAGKSVVCNVFKHLGAPIYDADSRARTLMTSHADLVAEIKAAFGEESYQADGQLNRTYLSGKVFNDEAELKKLNALVHPRVGEDFHHWIKEQRDCPYLIKEAALLIESGSYKELDKLIVVTASKETRIKRVLLRDLHRDRATVEAIIEKQLSDADFKQHADHIISNDEDTPILKKVLKLHESFMALGSQ